MKTRPNLHSQDLIFQQRCKRLSSQYNDVIITFMQDKVSSRKLRMTSSPKYHADEEVTIIINTNRWIHYARDYQQMHPLMTR